MNLPPGGTLAVTGAAGAVGGYTIQLAKAAGLQVIADAAPSDEELVRELGADHVVARGDDVAERILALRPEGVRGLVDGSLQGELVFPAIADGGRIAVLRGWNGGTTRGIGVEQVLVLRHAGETATLERLCEQAEQGVLTLRVARVLPAAMAPEAHRELEAGGVRGRLVLDFT
jgi:NADPH:quinone reductase-like Zn-dependent oxidoreductase